MELILLLIFLAVCLTGGVLWMLFRSPTGRTQRPPPYVAPPRTIFPPGRTGSRRPTTTRRDTTSHTSSDPVYPYYGDGTYGSTHHDSPSQHHHDSPSHHYDSPSHHDSPSCDTGGDGGGGCDGGGGGGD